MMAEAFKIFSNLGSLIKTPGMNKWASAKISSDSALRGRQI